MIQETVRTQKKYSMGNRLIQVLKIKPFLFLWLSEVFSQIAFNMTNFILILVVFDISSSNTAVSGIILSFTIPAILFGALAGVYADRWDKRRVLLITNVLRAVLLLLLAMYHVNLWYIYLISFSISVVTQFFIPAETPIIPLLVSKKMLIPANALFGVGIYASILIGYALSGVFLVFFGEAFAFLILSLLFLLSAFFISFLTKYKTEYKFEALPGRVALVSDIKNAFVQLKHTKDVYRSILLLTFSQMIILIFAVIGPGFAEQVLGIDIKAFPFLFVVPAAIGMLAGSYLVGSTLYGKSAKTITTIGVFLSGSSICLLPFSAYLASGGLLPGVNILYVMGILAFVLGLANAFVFIPSNALLQEETSNEIRGKIYGTLSALVGLFSLVPIVLVGGVADLFGVNAVLTAIGISVLLFGLYRLFLSRYD